MCEANSQHYASKDHAPEKNHASLSKHSLEPLLARPHPVCMYCFLWISCCIHQLNRILVASRTGFSVPKFSLQAGISGGRALGVARFVQPGRAYDNRAGTATLAWRKLGNTSVTAWQ